MLTVIGPDGCITTPYNDKCSVSLKQDYSYDQECVYVCEISKPHVASQKCVIYRQAKAPITSSKVVMKKFSLRLRKIKNFDGVVDITDIFSRVSHVTTKPIQMEKGKEKEKVTYCDGCGTDDAMKELTANDGGLYCDECYFRLDMDVNLDSDDGPHWPQNKSVDAIVAKKSVMADEEEEALSAILIQQIMLEDCAKGREATAPRSTWFHEPKNNLLKKIQEESDEIIYCADCIGAFTRFDLTRDEAKDYCNQCFKKRQKQKQLKNVVPILKKKVTFPLNQACSICTRVFPKCKLTSDGILNVNELICIACRWEKLGN